MIQEKQPGLRLLITGVAGLKRLAKLAEAFPTASFTNTTAHYLAQRYLRLRRDGTRLIKEPVEGHADLALAENVHLFREFVSEVGGSMPQIRPIAYRSRSPPASVAETLEREFRFDPRAASEAEKLLATDEAILDAFRAWLDTGQLDQEFQGSFPAWPCADCVPHPTMGELLDTGREPLDAFLRLGHLAHRVDEEIQVFVGQAGY